MTFETFKLKCNKNNSKIQSALQQISGTNYVSVLTSNSDRVRANYAQFRTLRLYDRGLRREEVFFYVTFSHTVLDGKKYVTFSAELPITNKVKYVVILDKVAYNIPAEYIKEKGYMFNGKRAVCLEELNPIPFTKVDKVFWDAKYMAFSRYSTKKAYGTYKIEVFKDKQCTEKLPVEFKAENGVELFTEFVKGTTADIKLSTFQYHLTKANENGEKVFKIKNPKTGAVLFVKITAERKNKTERKVTTLGEIEREASREEAEFEKFANTYPVDLILERLDRREVESLLKQSIAETYDSFVLELKRYYFLKSRGDR